MTTATWTFTPVHDSDANFRLWGANVNSNLAAAGLVQTADTGQINWTTVTRPGINTDAGYEIWYLNDTMHATQGLYIKLFYGTGTGTTRSRLRIQIGEGSNGSGTLTGQTSTETIAGNAQVSGSLGTSYLCVTEGMVGLAYCVGSPTASYALHGFIVGRTVDSSGAITDDGAFVITHSSATTTTSNYIGGQTVRFDATAATYAFGGGTGSDGPSFFLLPGTDATSATTAGDTQATVGWGPFPDYRPLLPVGVALIADLSIGSTASITFISGDSAHTYISLGASLGRTGARVNQTDDGNVALLMYWE